MANVISKPTGSRAVQTVLADGSRVSIGIGKVPKKAAESYRIQIEHLVGASIGGNSVPPATAEWLTTINHRLRSRLVELGLAAPMAVIEQPATTLGSLIERYLSDLDVKKRTVVRYRNQTQFMRDYFGDNTDVCGITKGDGERFHVWLKRKKKKNGEPLAVNYIHKIVKTSRQVFAAGIADNLIPENPLSDVKAPERITEDRDFEIDQKLTKRILSKASPKFQLVIALARYGGLRCPSELAGLRWTDILWDEDRFIVRSPKTEHCGKANRTVPIFPELLPYLLEAAERRPQGQEKVFRDIHEDTNLRTATERILKRCGVADGIPRFYQNCRSSRQTELEAAFPIHVICKWLGNTEGTARKHYLKVQEKHFEAAASAGMHQSMQLPTARCGKPSQASGRKQSKTLEKSSSPAFPAGAKYTREDSNL